MVTWFSQANLYIKISIVFEILWNIKIWLSCSSAWEYLFINVLPETGAFTTDERFSTSKVFSSHIIMISGNAPKLF